MLNNNVKGLIDEFISLDNRRKFLLREAIIIYKKYKKIDPKELIKPINELVLEINNISRQGITPNRNLVTEDFFKYK
ncbi:MAG: hypothetical protein K0S34_626 [Bacillales bacterium]|jgi:hypothetical protein|nr:hypothetical protein [Bacillales bacterium]